MCNKTFQREEGRRIGGLNEKDALVRIRMEGESGGVVEEVLWGTGDVLSLMLGRQEGLAWRRMEKGIVILLGRWLRIGLGRRY
jgi:hypothetical protein